MEQNKTGKYLKYAIGEIILVMVGILLALQVSNWNSERKNRISEQQILKNIHRDFLANKLQFDSIKNIHNTNFELIIKIIDLFPVNHDTIKVDSIKLFDNLIIPISYNPSSSSVESILNSSSFELIQNDSLKSYLTSWKDVLLDYLEEEKINNGFANNFYYPYLTDAFDFIGMNNALNLEAYSSIKFQNMVILRGGYFMNIVDALKNEPIENHINEIIRLSKPVQ